VVIIRDGLSFADDATCVARSGIGTSAIGLWWIFQPQDAPRLVINRVLSVGVWFSGLFLL